MCFRPCPTFSSLYLSSHLSMFWCFGYLWLLIGFTDSDVTIPSDSDPYRLLVISEPSDAISTPPMLPLLIHYLPLPFKKKKYFALRSKDLVRLRITSIWLRLCSTALLDLVPRTSTSTHCVLPRYTAFFWLFFVLACVLSVLLWSRSFFRYLHRTAFTNHLTHLLTLIQSLLSRISPISHPFIVHLPQELIYQDFHNF
jgi:hypothetical protein